MQQKRQILIWLVVLLFGVLLSAGYVFTQTKSNKSSSGNEKASSIMLSVSTNNDKDQKQDHCFEQNNNAKMIFSISVREISEGEAWVQLINLGYMNRAANSGAPADLEVNVAPIIKHKATVIFEPDPGSDSGRATPNRPHINPPRIILPSGDDATAIHLGSGPDGTTGSYLAIVSVLKAGDKTPQHRYYAYKTWKHDPSECFR